MRQPVPPHPRHRFARLLAVTAGLALALAAVPGLAGAAASGPQAGPVRADEVTASQDDLRTGWDPAETAMTPADVATFGQLFSTAVNGQVYAQPLVVGSTVIVATETDFVYGLDAATGAVLWQTSLGTPYHITSCSDLSPDVGVTGTPVYDPPAAGTTGDGTVYLVGQTMTKKTPGYGLFGIDPVTGAITENVPIGGKPANDSHITFNAAKQLERPGLLLMNGWVYSAFGSHCDHQPYAGFVSGVNVATKKTTLWTDESGVSDNEAGIWQGGGGVMSDGAGRIFVTSGNGISPAAGKGTSPPGQLAESVIRLAVGTTGALTAQDFYSPDNAPALDAADRDFGAGAPVGLPFGTSGGTTSYPDLLAQAAKDGRIFLLNRDSLGGRKQGGALSITTPYGGEWGHPAVFADTSTLTAANAATANNYLYFVGKSDPLRVFKFGVNAAGDPVLSDVANSSLVFGYTSGSPTVTSNGTDATTPVVWDTYVPNATGANAELEAYDVSSGALASCSSAAPCSLSPIFSAPIGTAAKFTVPATSNGRVYVGTRDGHVYGFGAPPAAAPVTGTTATFGQTGVSSGMSKTVSITAAKAVTVTGVTATTGASNSVTPASQFTVGQVTRTPKGSAAPVPVTFPVALAKGDKLNAAVTFTPAAAGGTDGILSFSTQSAAFPALAVPLAGDGTQTGLEAQPTTIAFPLAPDQGVTDVPVGTAVPQVVDITNYGTTADTVTSVTPPSGPFTAIGLPSVGTKILPGKSIPVQVTFAPSGAGPASGSFTVAGTNASSATVTLSAVGTAAVSQLTAAKPVVNFGTIPVAKKTTVYVDVTNSGNTPAIVTGTAALPSPFAAPIRPEKDLPFNPSYDLTLPVTFTPTKAGTFTAHYKLTWSDLKGTHTLDVVLTGKAT
jgi:Abnormal spindle-like microcephaly-assoc'd, ASPM-SPD-2-Hydin/PQQ-like domain